MCEGFFDCSDCLSISIFRRFQFLPHRSMKLQESSSRGLSISIFRRFQFLLIAQLTEPAQIVSFNLHFQEISILTTEGVKNWTPTEQTFNLHFQEISILTENTTTLSMFLFLVFQSPFSGDFNSYFKVLKELRGHKVWFFQSPFSGDFNSYLMTLFTKIFESAIFQSPFSGDFNSY